MISNRFINALPEGDRGEAVVIGIPFDGAAPAKTGARLGPDAIRRGSFSLETFSPYLDRDLAGRDYLDWGDIEVSPAELQKTLEAVEQKVSAILAGGMNPMVLGGEHCQTIAVVRALRRKYPNLMILHLDAHLGFQDSVNGELCCHAMVMRRVSEEVGPEQIFRIGTRSGSREEFQAAGVKLPLDPDTYPRDIEGVMKRIPKGIPLFVTLDLDVFDPSLVPGVINPEPWGLTWREFIQIARGLTYRHCIGFEAVELVPEADPTGVSALVAASAVRELMLSLMP